MVGRGFYSIFIAHIPTMKRKNIKLLIIILTMFIARYGVAQNPVNWTPDQLIEPSQLAKVIKEDKSVPIIFSVGPGAIIKNSTDIGMVKEKDNIAAFKKKLATLPKDANVVVYCGCCPFDHCPNVRPAIDVLKEMKFTNYKLLNLPHNVKTDWIEKGYPVTQ